MARKILLADDSVTAQNMGRKILADAGYEVTTVNNGSAALKKIGELKPDLIVLDVYMPGYSGLEVCQRLKEVAETARIPVLLTVGKLEPFKTDEAKRVRADGFIVKPFEASELLSALSKLEDKIVPRAEGSKTGRFARANAAIEEVKDKTVANEEDSGWKNRISFPHKKAAEAETNSDDPAIYNQVNKDLRTVVEAHPTPTPIAAEERVDLGALAPEGLPKDVTPEEIAALAAAAAQVQGKILEIKAEQEKETEKTAPVESKVEAAEVPSAAEPVADPVVSSVSSATFAEQTLDKVDQVFSALENKQSEPVPPTTVEAISDSTAGSFAHASAEQSVSELMTMAAAAGMETYRAPRWTGVAVALAPEEIGLNLEEEMRKSTGAFAAVETAPAPDLKAAEPTDPTPVAAKNEPAGLAPEPTPVASTPEVAEPVNAVETAATEPAVPAVKDFEMVAPAPVAETASWTPEAPQPAESVPSPAASQPEEIQVVGSEAPYQPVEQPTVEPVGSEAVSEGSVHSEIEEPKAEPASVEIPAPEAEVSAFVEAAVPEPSVASTEPVALSEPEPEHKEPDSEIAGNTAAAWSTWRKIRESDAPHAEKPASDEAAMAVAAGAEKTPEDVNGNDHSDPAIASIVDSVLADLRPKIVEEISRKLGKKK